MPPLPGSGRRWRCPRCAVAAVLAALLLPAAEGRISGGKYHIDRYVGGTDSGDGGQVVYLGTFGYGARGVCQIKVAGNATRGGETRSGFFLKLVNNVNSARAEPMQADDTLCRPGAAQDAKDGLQRVHMAQSEKKPAEWIGQVDIRQGGFWALFFYNCGGAEISLHVNVQQYNIVDDEGTRDYLQVGDRSLPMVYMLIFFIYLVLVGIWGWVMHKRPQYLHKVHFLMLLLLVLKTGTMLFESLKYHAFKETGTGSSWDVFFYTFLMLKGIALFLAILLLGTGWSFLKPHLAEKDRKILLIVLPLQVLVNICEVAIDETTEGDPSWKTWQDALRIFDIVCCCVVLLPIVWSVKNLKDASQADGKVMRNISRLKQFQAFYMLVVAYIYFTRIVVVLVESALHYKDTWLGTVILEAGTLFFYIFTGWKFRPVHQNPYLSLSEEDLAEGGAHLQQELQQKGRDERSAAAGEAAVAQPAETGGMHQSKPTLAEI
eukprot:TRINITY_DN55285_c0_g1_i1.p1 TRINITY_DN55285_c0_g1~~TRINITY_DN55285_c0_g1_i1.p1  ORF type:complete len:512 (+),score=196.08 TRINITY_DN55285_c0_g1_i1:71-1537(+)